ncbi:MAG: imidazole glycerol phosphate synthase subunit HisH [Pantoea sp. Brub]|nr:imidazole glycerol phosphate synthase subunit HisH [Pantoea sp. Brub]
MNIVILNTGCANLTSVKWAIKRLGYIPDISCNPNTILNADKLILPGVGTARTAMNQLKKYNLINLIKEFTKPVLGICLGMQLLGNISEENGGTPTLGIVDEKVSLVKTNGLPLPHIGWNSIDIKTNNYLFNGITNGSYFYFVHSYAMSINDNTISQCYYGELFTAAIQKDNFFGVQFHPERSSKVGKKLLKNFLEI